MVFWTIAIALAVSVVLIVGRAVNSVSDESFVSRHKIGVISAVGVLLLAGGAWVYLKMGQPDAQVAAEEFSVQGQTEMVRGLVMNLSDRLASEGGSAQEWARLISSLGILGDLEQARDRWSEAQEIFAKDPDGLAEVRAGARRAGVAE